MQPSPRAGLRLPNPHNMILIKTRQSLLGCREIKKRLANATSGSCSVDTNPTSTSMPPGLRARPFSKKNVLLQRDAKPRAGEFTMNPFPARYWLWLFQECCQQAQQWLNSPSQYEVFTIMTNTPAGARIASACISLRLCPSTKTPGGYIKAWLEVKVSFRHTYKRGISM